MDRNLVRRWGLVGLLVGIFLFLFWRFSDRSISQDQQRTLSIPSLHSRVRKDFPSLKKVPLVDVPLEASIDASVCTDDEVLEDLLEACKLEFIAADCPTPFRAIDEEHRTYQLVEAACGEGLDFRIDCSVWPCMVVMETEGPDCLDTLFRIEDSSDVGGGFPVAYGLDRESWNAKILKPLIREREPQRLRRMKMVASRGGVGSSLQDVASCSVVKGWEAEPPTCEQLLSYSGCVQAPSSESVEEIERYFDEVESVLIEHVERCEAFGQVNWSVDCSDIPCVVAINTDGFVHEEDGDRMDAMMDEHHRLACGASWSGGTWVKIDTSAGPITTFPLYLESIPDGAFKRYQRNAAGRRVKTMLGMAKGVSPWRGGAPFLNYQVESGIVVR